MNWKKEIINYLANSLLVALVVITGAFVLVSAFAFLIWDSEVYNHDMWGFITRISIALGFVLTGYVRMDSSASFKYFIMFLK